MTRQRDLDLDRMLDAWFADGPVEAPDRALDDVHVRIRRQRQRPAWLLTRRVPAVSTPIRLLAIAAVLVGAFAIGTALLVGSGQPVAVIDPTASPVADATSSPIAAVSPLPFPSRRGSLDAGRYSATLTPGTVTFTLPDGWASGGMIPNSFSMQAPGSAANDGVHILADMRRAAMDDACTEAPEPGVGTTAADLLASLQGDDQLVVSEPVVVSLPGLTGVRVDIRLAEGTTRTCPFSDGAVTVPLVVDAIAGEGPFWGVSEGEIERLYLLDAANGHSITMIVDSAKGDTFDALTTAAEPVFETMSFVGGESVATQPTPAPAATAVPSPSDGPRAFHSYAVMEPGEYSADVHIGSLAFTLPDGWASPSESDTGFSLRPLDGPAKDIVNIYTDMRRPLKDDACTEAPDPAVKAGARPLLADLAADDQLVVTEPVAVKLPGLTGWSVDIRLSPTATRTCPFSDGKVTVPIVVDEIPRVGPFWGIDAGGAERLYAFDTADGHTVMVLLESVDGQSFGALAAATASVVDTFTFTPDK